MDVKYKGKITVDVGAYYAPYIPINIVAMENKVTFKVKDIGEKRWLCFADVPVGMIREFEDWMAENMPDIWVNKSMWKPNIGHQWPPQTKHYELRGGNIGDQTMLLLKWGK